MVSAIQLITPLLWVLMEKQNSLNLITLWRGFLCLRFGGPCDATFFFQMNQDVIRTIKQLNLVHFGDRRSKVAVLERFKQESRYRLFAENWKKVAVVERRPLIEVRLVHFDKKVLCPMSFSLEIERCFIYLRRVKDLKKEVFKKQIWKQICNWQVPLLSNRHFDADSLHTLCF